MSAPPGVVGKPGHFNKPFHELILDALLRLFLYCLHGPCRAARNCSSSPTTALWKPPEWPWPEWFKNYLRVWFFQDSELTPSEMFVPEAYSCCCESQKTMPMRNELVILGQSCLSPWATPAPLSGHCFCSVLPLTNQTVKKWPQDQLAGFHDWPKAPHFENKHTEVLNLSWTLLVRDTEHLVFHWLLLIVPFFSPSPRWILEKRNRIRFLTWWSWNWIRGRTVLWPKWHMCKHFSRALTWPALWDTKQSLEQKYSFLPGSPGG